MKNSAKDFSLQLGSLIALYISIISLITLLFGVITVSFPDSLNGIWEHNSATSGIRSSIAFLIVFYPTYIILTAIVNKGRRLSNTSYHGFTKWLVYFSLLVGGGVLLGDLVAIINTFLNGELTARFFLKVLVVLIVIGSAFTYYLFDLRGYWREHKKYSQVYAVFISLAVLMSLFYGVQNTETPQEIRDIAADSQQIRDLGDIQWRIEEYVRTEDDLPETIEEVYEGILVPTAPENRDSYTYEVINKDSFNLCATFVFDSINSKNSFPQPIFIEDRIIKNPSNWDHGTGKWCFERAVEIAKKTS